MSTQERDAVLTAFTNREFPILVATGLVGRGLDLVHVNQVINFDLPSSIEGEQL